MTTTTKTTTTYRILIPIATTYVIQVERGEGDVTTREELLRSVTRDELSQGDMGDVWSDIKNGFGGDTDFFTIEDEDGEELLSD